MRRGIGPGSRRRDDAVLTEIRSESRQRRARHDDASSDRVTFTTGCYNPSMPSLLSQASSLFPHAVEPAAGPFAGVALEQGIDRVLDYSIPPRLAGQVQVGQAVRVPLGRGNKVV